MEIELVDILSALAVIAVFVGLFAISFWFARIGMRNRQRYEREYWRNLREFEKFKHDLYKDDNDNTSKPEHFGTIAYVNASSAQRQAVRRLFYAQR